MADGPTTAELQAEMDRRFLTARREMESARDLLSASLEQKERALRAALVSADKLELARIDIVHREHQADTKAASEAVAKAEAATEKRFEGVNEWRGQSADRERSQQEQTARLTATFLPREVADAQFAEMRKQINVNTDRLNDQNGERRGVSEYRALLISLVVVLVGLAAVISPHIR